MYTQNSNVESFVNFIEYSSETTSLYEIENIENNQIQKRYIVSLGNCIQLYEYSASKRNISLYVRNVFYPLKHSNSTTEINNMKFSILNYLNNIHYQPVHLRNDKNVKEIYEFLKII